MEELKKQAAIRRGDKDTEIRLDCWFSVGELKEILSENGMGDLLEPKDPAGFMAVKITQAIASIKLGLAVEAAQFLQEAQEEYLRYTTKE